MKLNGMKVLVTGAAGGIGSCVARRLAAHGARLMLTDLRAESLEELAAELRAGNAVVDTLAADFTTGEGRGALATRADTLGLDTLINVAGINPFGLVTDQVPADIERALTVNAVAPILLCQALLPVLARSDAPHIVNVGSIFGSIGFPGFCAYSASKFALRGFTEALRRELADTAIRVHYVAPRATRTALNTDRVAALNSELNIATDPPERVAKAVERTLLNARRETYIGMPERLFVAVNAILPGVVDRALRKQLSTVRRFAGPSQPAAASAPVAAPRNLGVAS